MTNTNKGNEGNRINLDTISATDLIFLDNNMYGYKNHIIHKKKLSEKTLKKFPELINDNITHGWKVNNDPCMFGGLKKAQSYIDGII